MPRWSGNHYKFTFLRCLGCAILARPIKESHLVANSAPNQFLAATISNRTITPTAANARRSARYVHLFLLPLLFVALLASANGQTSGAAVGYLPPQGGAGGGQYKAQCVPTE